MPFQRPLRLLIALQADAPSDDSGAALGQPQPRCRGFHRPSDVDPDAVMILLPILRAEARLLEPSGTEADARVARALERAIQFIQQGSELEPLRETLLALVRASDLPPNPNSD